VTFYGRVYFILARTFSPQKRTLYFNPYISVEIKHKLGHVQEQLSQLLVVDNFNVIRLNIADIELYDIDIYDVRGRGY